MTFHDNPLQDDWRNDASGVKYFHFYGNQAVAQTIGKLTAVSRPFCDTAGRNCKTINELTKTYVRGDGTVPVLSAARTGGGINLNASGALVRAFPGGLAVEHTGLTQNPEVFAAILSALNSNSTSQSKNSSPVSDNHVRAHHVFRTRSLPIASAQSDTDPAHYVTAWGVSHVLMEDSQGNRNDPIPGTGIGDRLPNVTYDLGLNSVSLVMPVD